MIFDPEREDQRPDYFYSLILLFVPFRDESSLLIASETAEETFHRLLPVNYDCLAYHSRLQTMLKAQASVKKIDEVRQADGVEQNNFNEDDDPHLFGEAKAAM